ncbi:MAG: hypothetical protein CL910_21875 [Deltaproteobacteria bacterium]|nr:hypothetical protein [Deltaproteobacteria bacterium]
MKRLGVGLLAVLGAVAAYVIAHLALIELGQEVVVLHKWISDGETRKTRLWIFDDERGAWFHHGYADSAWIQQLEVDPIVTVDRAGVTRRNRATPIPGPHEVIHRLAREKYGLADRWVRFIGGGTEDCQAVPVRLEPIGPQGS